MPEIFAAPAAPIAPPAPAKKAPLGRVPAVNLAQAPCAVTAPGISVELVDWCSTTALQDADDAEALLTAPGETWLFRRLAGFAPSLPPTTATLPDWACAVFGPKPGYWPVVIVMMAYLPLRVLDWMIAIVIPDICDAGIMSSLVVRSAEMGIAERWIGVDFGPARVSLTNQFNYACPQTVVQPESAIAAYLHGTIQQSEARKWARVNGWCDYTTTLAIDGAKWRPSAQDIVTWRNWNCLSKTTSDDAELKKLGMIDAEYRTAFLCSAYTPLGVGDVYRLLHECRPGAPAGRPTYTKEDATADLTRLGYSARDIPFMLYLARTPLPHRQVIQPYYQGDLSKDQLNSFLLDDGYDADDIALLMPFYDAQANAWVAKEVGYPDVKEIIKGLADGTLTADAATSVLALNGTPNTLLQQVGTVVQYQRQSDVRAAGIAAARAGLKAGETSAAQAISELSSFGVPADAAQLIVQEWQLEAAARVKPIGASQLCTWYSQNLVSAAEYEQRLANLGYSAVDAGRIMHLCAADAAKKAQAALNKQITQQLAAKAKSETAEAKAAKAAQAVISKANLAAARAKQTADKAALAAIRADLTTVSGVAGHVLSREDGGKAAPFTPSPGPPDSDVSSPPSA